MRALAAVALLLPSAAHAAEGMPQLDFANPLTVSQVVWLAIIFLAFYLMLRSSALPRVGQVLANRTARIEGDLHTAREAKEEADKATADVAAGIRAARADSQARIAEAVAKAKDEAASQAHADDERLDKQLEEAEARIEASRKQAMGALRQVAAETASAVVQRLTGAAPAPGAVDTEVGGILAARGQA